MANNWQYHNEQTERTWQSLVKNDPTLHQIALLRDGIQRVWSLGKLPESENRLLTRIILKLDSITNRSNPHFETPEAPDHSPVRS